MFADDRKNNAVLNTFSPLYKCKKIVRSLAWLVLNRRSVHCSPRRTCIWTVHNF